MNQFRFSRKTFKYFEEARKNADSRPWFESHKSDYEENVIVPFTHLIVQMKEQFRDQLPGIDISTKKIAKPLRRQIQGSAEPLIRSKTTAFFSEPATSMFESNPGIYISLGASPADNLYGVGLYDVSSRQMNRLRPAFISDPAAADACLKNRSIEKHWGGLSGERLKRFPKGFEETAPGAEYLWHKQFLLSKSLTRTVITKDTFIETAIEDFAAAVPFFQWLRATAGVYKKQSG